MLCRGRRNKRNETWKIGINGINREADFVNKNVDGQRWKKFNIDQTGSFWRGNNNLWTTLHTWRNNPMQKWFEEQITVIRKYSQRPNCWEAIQKQYQN